MKQFKITYWGEHKDYSETTRIFKGNNIIDAIMAFQDYWGSLNHIISVEETA